MRATLSRLQSSTNRALMGGINLPTLAALLAAVTIVCLLIGGIELVYLEQPYNKYISYAANDMSLLRPGAYMWGKNFGVHYFSDFLIPYDWALQSNPWTDHPRYPAQYPPLPIYLVKLLTGIPYNWAIGLYLLAMAASVVVAVFLLTRNLPFSTRLTLSITFGIASTPLMKAFDRGNFIGFFALLFALFLIGVLRNNKILAVTALTIMVCLKIYPIVLIIVLLKKKWWMPAIYTIAISAVVSFALFAITPGNVVTTISSFVQANFLAANIHDSDALVAFSKSFKAVLHVSSDTSWRLARGLDLAITVGRYVTLVAIVVAVTFRRNLHVLEVAVLGGFAMMLLYGAQIGYNWTWAPVTVVGILVIMAATHGSKLHLWRLLKSYPLLGVAVIGITLLALPTGWHFPGSARALTAYIGLATAVVCTAIALFRRRKFELVIR